MKIVSKFALIASSLVLFACSAEAPDPGPSTSALAPAPAATTASANPKAPQIQSVSKMTGSLHVVWKNQDTGCSAIEVERQGTMASGAVHEKYSVVYTLAGEADNKHDTSATADMKYSYRVRCKKAAAYSEYSNEASGNPVR